MMKHPTNNEIWFAEQRDLAIEERDEQRARAEALAAELRELRENVMLGLGMTAAAVAAVDDELADSTIGYLLTGHKEMAAALRHMTVERNTISSSWDVLAAEVERLTADNAALRTFRAPLDAGGEGWRRTVEDAPLNTPVDIKAWGKRYDIRGKWHVYLGSHLVANVYPGDCEWRPAPPQE